MVIQAYPSSSSKWNELKILAFVINVVKYDFSHNISVGLFHDK